MRTWPGRWWTSTGGRGAWRTWAGDGGHGEHEQENFGHWKEHGIVENMSRSQDDMENR